MRNVFLKMRRNIRIYSIEIIGETNDFLFREKRRSEEKEEGRRRGEEREENSRRRGEDLGDHRRRGEDLSDRRRGEDPGDTRRRGEEREEGRRRQMRLRSGGDSLVDDEVQLCQYIYTRLNICVISYLNIRCRRGWRVLWWRK